MRTKKNVRILGFFLLFVLNESVHAALPPAFRAGRFRVSAESEYFSTTSNFDQDGEEVDLASGRSFKVLATKVDGSFFLANNWSLTGGLGINYAASEHPITDRTNSELTDGHFEVLKLIPFTHFRIIPAAEVLVALTEVETDQDEVITNESANAVKVGSWAVVPFGPVRVYGFAGYQYRDDGRANLLPWNLGLDWRNPSFGVSGEIGGYKTIEDDEFATQRGRRTGITNEVNGGSLRFYSVNPSLTALKLEGTYNATRDTSFKLGVTHTVAGESTAAGTGFLVGFATNFDRPPLTAQREMRRAEKDTRPRGPRPRGGTRDGGRDNVREFTPDTEANDYDERVFEPNEDYEP